WILVATVNRDDSTVRLGTGAIVSARSSISKGTVVPCGTIVMWYGDAKTIPDGWALCDGSNGTPNLKDRVLVAAGGKYNPAETGGQDSVKLAVENLPAHNHTGTTSLSGAHYHQGKLDTGSGGSGGSALMPSGGNFVMNEWYTTETSSEHSHTVTVSSSGDAKAMENRPAYYAVYFIMKVF